MGKISSRMVFEIITIIGIVTFAVISLTPSTAKQQSVQLDHGRMSYSGAVLKHKFDGQGTLQVNKQGRYVGNFTNGRFEGAGEFCTERVALARQLQQGCVEWCGQTAGRQQDLCQKNYGGR